MQKFTRGVLTKRRKNNSDWLKFTPRKRSKMMMVEVDRKWLRLQCYSGDWTNDRQLLRVESEMCVDLIEPIGS